MKEKKQNQSHNPIHPLPETKQNSPLASPNTDPEGSYTGVCEKKDELPTQDADDL